MKLVANPLAEIYDIAVEFFAIRQQRLPGHIRACEEGAIESFFIYVTHANDSHIDLPKIYK
jgi:hypothetical protein